MAYKTKQKTVEAESVGAILQLVETDFRSLPDWVKKQYQEQKLFFGFSSIKISQINFLEEARSGDVLVKHESGKLEVLSEHKFFETYEALP